MITDILSSIFNKRTNSKNGVVFKRMDRKKRKFLDTKRTLFVPTRSFVIDDITRRFIATELYDTFKGLGSSYIKAMIEAQFKTDFVKADMMNLTVCLPILKNFINQISKVYNKQPVRKFFTDDGKQIVKELPKYAKDKKRYLVNPKLVDVFEKSFYNTKNHTVFKFFEKMVNLQKTIVVKTNYNEESEEMDLVYIPNDLIQVDIGEENNKVEELCFSKKNFNQVSDTMVDYSYQEAEAWTKEFYFKYSKKGDIVELPNNAPLETKKLFKSIHIGEAFAPFAVLKHNFATQEFWDIEDLDTVNTIKNLNVAFTELRYLIRYGAFGLKYVKDLDVDKDSVHDLRGIIQLQTQSKAGDQDSSEIGEFQNRGDIKAVVEGILAIMKILYDNYGLTLDGLVSTSARASAESKIVDSYKLYQFIVDNQDIWQLNEERIFKSMCSVWNRDNKKVKIPAGVEMLVDFADLPMENIDKQAEAENMQVLIDRNIKTITDWMRKENPDLSEEEAKMLMELNKAANEDKEADLEKDDATEKKDALDADKKENGDKN